MPPVLANHSLEEKGRRPLFLVLVKNGLGSLNRNKVSHTTFGKLKELEGVIKKSIVKI